MLRSHLDHVSWWPALDQELLVRPNPAAPPGLEGRSGPARPLHPLASTRHPLVMRCSHGAGSLQALESFWSGSHFACSSSVSRIRALRGNPTLPLQGVPPSSVSSRGFAAFEPRARYSCAFGYSSSADAKLEEPGRREGEHSNRTFPLIPHKHVASGRCGRRNTDRLDESALLRTSVPPVQPAPGSRSATACG